MTIRITIKNGECHGDHHKVGQEFIVEHTTPAGMCLGSGLAI